MASIDEQVAAVAARQHGVFRSDQVGELSRAQIRTRTQTGRWRRCNLEVFAVAGAPDTWEQQVWCALLVAGRGTVVGRRSALRIHGLNGVRGDHVDLVQPETTVPNGKPTTSRRTSRLPVEHATTVRGFPVTTVERTLFDLAGLSSPQRLRRGWVYLHEDRVERFVEDALARRMVSIRTLAAVHADLAGRGRPGTRLMRRLIEERSEGYVATESELESLFVKLIESHGLPRPRRQVSIGSGETWIGRVDFVFEEAKLVVEADGRRYHEQKTPTLSDRTRDLRLIADGWQVLRVDWWRLVDDGPNVARLLGRAIGHRRTA